MPHILQKIFRSLDYESFKASAEVCVTWNNLLTTDAYKIWASNEFYNEICRDLIERSRAGSVNEVKSIVSTFTVYVDCVEDHHLKTPISLASQNGHTNVVHLLLVHGADPNKADIRGRTPLHFATLRGHQHVVQLLLDEDQTDPNIEDNRSNTPLHEAAREGQRDLVQLLIQYGSNPNVVNASGHTALDLATQNGHADIVNILAPLSYHN